MRTLLVLLAALLPATVQAQAYPNKPIRWIVPYTGGGITDVVTRVVTQKMAGRSASRSWSTTGRARTASSARTSPPRRRRTATPC